MFNMARKKFRKNRRDFVAIPFSAAITLSTLADNIVLTDGLTNAFLEDLFVIAVDSLWSIHGLTAGEVPIIFGFAHDDLNVTEIAEHLGAELIDPSDIITRERARRPVRKVGQFARGALTEQQLNNGLLERTRIKFMVGDGHTLAAWVQNRSGATLTTGAIVEISGTLFGRWVR